MLDFYEMKAIDPYEAMQQQDSMYEEEKEQEKESMLQNIQRVESQIKERRSRQKAANNNLDDSREDDFEGLDDIQFGEAKPEEI